MCAQWSLSMWALIDSGGMTVTWGSDFFLENQPYTIWLKFHTEQEEVESKGKKGRHKIVVCVKGEKELQHTKEFVNINQQISTIPGDKGSFKNMLTRLHRSYTLMQ